jgi:5-dehydro-2-deoxygluconokinase|tara:strand:- start:2398 stop:3390 length:993 start_codon:yes stop_codon:yes gene_type:complete
MTDLPHTSPEKTWHALVLGRAGLDLYPQPDGGKTSDAHSFSADMGGSGGNIAAAMGCVGAKVALLSAVSDDAIGHFVRQRLEQYHVSDAFLQTSQGNSRTSLAIAEVRPTDCDVVIYRNDAADLQLRITDAMQTAVVNSNNLVVTGTALISEPSRTTSLELMKHAKSNGCTVWLDLDYRPWNWPDLQTTRTIYSLAAKYADVVIGNEEEFAVLTDQLEDYITQANLPTKRQAILLKRGGNGASLFNQGQRLDTGVYPVKPLKPYGAGDAFLGNLVHHYNSHHDWQAAIACGSAAAAIVVSQRGCASAMPNAEQINLMQQSTTMKPTANWC